MNIRIGIIGLEYWEPNLVRNFLKFDTASILYCCDSNPKQKRVFQKKFPSIPFTTSAQDIFDDSAIEEVVIATALEPV